MLMRFITRVGDGKGFYGESNDRDLAWCNGVKHPKSGRNDLRLEVLASNASPDFGSGFCEHRL